VSAAQHLAMRRSMDVIVQRLDALPLSGADSEPGSRHTKPGLPSASRLISSMRDASPAIAASFMGARIRATFT
jgi:hypothetical protein